MKRLILVLITLTALMVPLAFGAGGSEGPDESGSGAGSAPDEVPGGRVSETSEFAVFGAGCFWCLEKPYDVLEGVLATISGYAGGDTVNPTYQQVTSGLTGHTEVVRIEYDPALVTYQELLYVFWRNVDPFDGTGQFCDRGSSYRPAIYYYDEPQGDLARRSAEQVASGFDQDLAVEIEPLEAFYPAESYHQNFYMTNSTRYETYRALCGRDRRLEQIWGDQAGGENPPDAWF